MVSNDVTGFPKKETSLDPETDMNLKIQGGIIGIKDFGRILKKRLKMYQLQQ